MLFGNIDQLETKIPIIKIQYFGLRSLTLYVLIQRRKVLMRQLQTLFRNREPVIE